MSRGLAAAALAELYAQETDGIWLTLVTIAHADITTIRLVANTEDVVSNSNTFTAFPFQIVLPPDREAELPRAQIVLDNVDRTIVTAVRTVSGQAADTVEVVRSSDPDTILASWAFISTGATYDELTVAVELSAEPILDEPYPGTTFSPILFVALFKRAAA